MILPDLMQLSIRDDDHFTFYNSMDNQVENICGLVICCVCLHIKVVIASLKLVEVTVGSHPDVGFQIPVNILEN